MVQPAHLIYDVDKSSGKVTSLQAIWELTDARPYSHTWSQLIKSVLLMPVVFVSILKNYGVWWTIRYSIGFLTGPLSGGRSIAKNLLARCEAKQGISFLSLFETPDDQCVRHRGESIRPRILYESVWGQTSRITAVGPVRCSGWKTTLQYKRTTNDGREWRGFVELDISRRSLFTSAIHSMYVYEEADT